MTIRLGTAGWTVPKATADAFPADGSHLARYAQRFNAAEINSSFHKPHRRATYERWAASVPDTFRFAVKLPKQITHTLRLAGTDAALDAFAEQAGGLGDKLGPVLVQLPPSFAFDADVAGAFFTAFRARFTGLAVCEPRHPTWLGDGADALLRAFRIARAAAHPAIGLRDAVEMQAGGWPGLFYLRLHGAPKVYYSDYDEAALANYARRLKETAAEAWCIFDNTASGNAAANALTLQRLLTPR